MKKIKDSFFLNFPRFLTIHVFFDEDFELVHMDGDRNQQRFFIEDYHRIKYHDVVKSFIIFGHIYGYKKIIRYEVR